MYIPTCAPKLNKEYSAYIQGRRKTIIWYSGYRELNCAVVPILGISIMLGNIGGSGGVCGFEEGRSETRKGSFVS